MRSHLATALVGVLAVSTVGPAVRIAAAAEPSMPASHQVIQTTTDAASDLRVTLDLALGEHIVLALKATGAALHGDPADFDAYNLLLNTNGTDIGALIGSVYGQDAEAAFDLLWSAHNGFFVDYTLAAAAGDRARQDQAVDDLTTMFVPGFSSLIASATGLPLDAVTSLTTDHILQTKAVVDAQAAADWTVAYDAIRAAYGHMRMMGDALAAAITAQHPDVITGDPGTPATELRVALDQALQEHLYLTTFATRAVLDDRTDEASAAMAALDASSADVTGLLGSSLDADAQGSLEALWTAQDRGIVDYATAVAADDQAARDAALDELTTTVAGGVATLLTSATGLSEEDLGALTTDHVLATTAVVDAQASGDATTIATADQAAARQLRAMGDALAGALVGRSSGASPVVVGLADFTVTPAHIDVQGPAITFEVTNTGPTPHNLTIRDAAGTVLGATPDLRTGEASTLTITFPGPGTYTMFCSLPGHESLGLKGDLVVR